MFCRWTKLAVSLAKRRHAGTLAVFTRVEAQYKDTGQFGGGAAGVVAPINNTIDATAAAFTSFLMGAVSLGLDSKGAKRVRGGRTAVKRFFRAILQGPECSWP